jgi:hypothetical protein
MNPRMDYAIAFDAAAEKIYQDIDRQHWQTLMDAHR